MLTKTLPTLDIYFNVHGSLSTSIYSPDADTSAEPEDTDELTLESLAKEFVKNAADEDTGLIEDPQCVDNAYAILDSLYEAIKIIESKVYEEDTDGAAEGHF